MLAFDILLYNHTLYSHTPAWPRNNCLCLNSRGDYQMTITPCPNNKPCYPLIGTPSLLKYFFPKNKLTLTKTIITGTSMSGPMTAANAAPELIPNTATATAMASSKLLLAAVKAKVTV